MSRRQRLVLYHPQSAVRREPPHCRWPDELPLPLLTIAAWPLRRGYDVVLVDGTRVSAAEARGRVLEACEGALLFATTGILGPQVRDALQVTRAVKARFPDLPALVGGWFASVVPELYLATGLFDAVALGQGEITFRELVAAVDAGTPLEEVAGLALLRDGLPVRSARRPIVAWDRLLDCPWDLLQPEDYRVPQQRMWRGKGRGVYRNIELPSFQIAYFSSFGCPLPCTFCCSPSVSGQRWQAMSAERMLDDLCALQDRWGFDSVHFNDANFGVDVRRMVAFAEGLLRRGLRMHWLAYVQAESFLRCTDEELDALAASGLYGCVLGAEAGSAPTMARVRKPTREGGNLEAARRLAARGIVPRMTYMIGFPWEDRCSMLATIDEARRVVQHCPGARPEIWPFLPIPGSEDWNEALERGYAPPARLEDWGAVGDYWEEAPWPGRIPADVERRRRLFMHFSSLALGVVRERSGWWERRARRHIARDTFGAGGLEARAFHVWDHLTRRQPKRSARMARQQA